MKRLAFSALAPLVLAAPALADDFTPYTMDLPKVQAVINKAQREGQTVLRYRGEVWIPLDALNNTLAVLDTFEAEAVKAKNDALVAVPPPPAPKPQIPEAAPAPPPPAKDPAP